MGEEGEAGNVKIRMNGAPFESRTALRAIEGQRLNGWNSFLR
jgi:hypothetical protein